MIKIGNSSVRSLASEMTVKEWEGVKAITAKMETGLQSDKGDPAGNIDLWFEIFEMLGAKEDDTDRIGLSELGGLILKFNEDREKVKVDKFTRTLRLNGRDYVAFAKGEKFELSAKTIGVIEKVMKLKGAVTFAEIVAACFKDVQKTRADHYDAEHVIEKAVDFETITADVALPYIARWSVEFGEFFKTMKDAAPGELE